MKQIASLLCVIALAGCSQSTSGIEPIPGSITYGGQPQSRLTKAPVGSAVTNRLRDQFGQGYEETYIIQPDRSLKLVSRQRVEFPNR
ncbi:hypothetical protein LH464_21215 [Neorhizobium sp. T786]|uniref:hypothetical protein n=1 Tax=Pseudorhizobium xiangyangii TaxID=2883104 RepID=UPI001CFF5838|nr:hypothetical protein [Neorhizobium xiangyangii]MCB5204989.1 hypothetical protein [Neorhizobium xiangyangii]